MKLRNWWKVGLDEDDLVRETDRTAWFNLRVFQAILMVCAFLSFSLILWIHLELYSVALAVSGSMLVLFIVGSFWLERRDPYV